MFRVAERTRNITHHVGLMEQMVRVAFLAGLVNGVHLRGFGSHQFAEIQWAGRGAERGVGQTAGTRRPPAAAVSRLVRRELRLANESPE
jgi:hypothetical protein